MNLFHLVEVLDRYQQINSPTEKLMFYENLIPGLALFYTFEPDGKGRHLTFEI